MRSVVFKEGVKISAQALEALGYYVVSLGFYWRIET